MTFGPLRSTVLTKTIYHWVTLTTYIDHWQTTYAPKISIINSQDVTSVYMQHMIGHYDPGSIQLDKILEVHAFIINLFYFLHDMAFAK